VLFYRQDLLDKYHLPVPRDWAALTAAAATVQRGERAAGNRQFWGFVWQGRAYEGLTCNALEWIASFGGGGIVAADGKVDVDTPRAIAALTMAHGWVGTVSPPGVLNYGEEEARGVFQSGNALFMRNWPYAWALAQGADSAVRGKVGVAALPAGPGGAPAAVLGGWQLAVSKFSAHPRQAAALVLYLTSRAEQKRRAIEYAYSPTMPALFDDPEVLAAAPFLARLRPVFAHALARPSAVVKTRYNQVSAAIWTRVHAALAGQGTPAAELRALQRGLRRIGHGGRW
jgi:trehalose/maltose transport system substrate-binding protein